MSASLTTRYLYCLQALAKNGEYIGERYVRLLHVPKSEMEEQVRLGTLAIPGTAAKVRSRQTRPSRPMMGGGGYMRGPMIVPTAMQGGRGVPGGMGGPYGGQMPMDARAW